MTPKTRTAAATLAVTSIAAALAFALPASATVIYSTGFEAPTFTTGALNGQGGWSVSPSGANVTVENTFVHGGAQAVELGAGDEGVFFADPFTPTGQVVVSMEAYYATGDIFEITVGSTPGPDMTAGISLHPSSADAVSPSFPDLGTISQNAWHNFVMTLDYATQTYDVSVDGSLLASGIAFCGGQPNSATCLGNPISQFDGVGVLALSKESGNYIDDVSISESVPEGVPEPGAWALMLVGMAGLGGALRQRRRTTVAA